MEEHSAVVSGSATRQMERNATESVMVVVIQSKEVELFFSHSFKELGNLVCNCGEKHNCISSDQE